MAAVGGADCKQLARRAAWVVACALCGLLSTMATATPAHASMPVAADVAAEARQVKAAYLYKFASYVDWPAGVFARRDSPVVIGVAGDESLRAVLAQMVRDQTVHGRRLEVRRVEAGDTLAGLHVLFVGSAGSDETGIMRAAQGQPILLVSDSTRVRKLGSMIDLVKVDDRLRFDVALGQATRSGLQLSALMLSAARRVDREAF